MKHVGIRGKMLLAFTLLLLLVCSGLGYGTYLAAASIFTAEAEQRLQEKAYDANRIVRERLDRRFAELEMLATYPELTSMEWNRQQPVLREHLNHTDYLALAVVYPEGTARYADGSTLELGDRAYVQEAFDGISNMSDPLVSRATGDVVMMVAVPIYHRDEVAGVLIGRQDGYYLCELTADIGYGETGYAFMLNRSGDTVAHVNRELVQNQVNIIVEAETAPELRPLATLMAEMIQGRQGAGAYYYDGIRRFMGYAPVRGTDWTLGVAVPRSDVLGALTRLVLPVFIVALAALLLGSAVVLLVSNSITRPLQQVVKVIETTAGGDFQQEINASLLRQRDETGLIAAALKQMQQSLQKLFAEVRNSADRVHGSSESLAASSQEMNASLEEVAARSNEFAHSTHRLTALAGEMGASGEDVSQKAAAGDEALQQAVQQMQAISGMVSNLKEVISGLDEQARDIGKIVSAIKKIADQTNLLALNAAIEAERAGSQGRGFAVVADEVRKLAEQSAVSAEEITELVGAVQQQIGGVSREMDEGEKTVSDGVAEIMAMSDTLKGVIGSIESITVQIAEVNASTREMGAGGEEISAAVQEQTATMGDIASTANELQELVEKLQEGLNRFKY